MRVWCISTLAPREGSDDADICAVVVDGISTLAPREGSDACGTGLRVFYFVFLPSLPARGATTACRNSPAQWVISTLAPREGSDAIDYVNLGLCSNISTLAPREGSDQLLDDVLH